MSDIPETGWYVERDAWLAKTMRPHRLWFNGKHFAWITTEQADAFPSTEEKLPDGIRAGYLLDPDHDVSEGWERQQPSGTWATWALNPRHLQQNVSRGERRWTEWS
jgi:hypothetical protein